MTSSTPTTELPAEPRRRGTRRRGAWGRIFTPLAWGVVLVVGLVSGWAWWHGSLGGLPVRAHCLASATDVTAELDPEQAANAATIAAIAVHRGLPARAATIGIATAMQESKLYNLPDGDRDSIGLFQQRPSQGWGTAEQVHDPVYATNAFYDVLVTIEGYQDLPITKAAQQVQRSAFPSAYASHEPEARLWASTLSGYSTAGLTCVLESTELPEEKPGANNLTARAQGLVSAAKAETGRSGRAVADADGTAVLFPTTSAEAPRLAWALAQWAVARAEGLAVVAVEVDGRQWRRDHQDQGWTTHSEGPAAGAVVVRVA